VRCIDLHSQISLSWTREEEEKEEEVLKHAVRWLICAWFCRKQQKDAMSFQGVIHPAYNSDETLVLDLCIQVSCLSDQISGFGKTCLIVQSYS